VEANPDEESALRKPAFLQIRKSADDEFQKWWRTESEYKMFDVDALVERVWDIYYTALALDRVPSVMPFEEGAIMSTAIQHVLTPRFLNPAPIVNSVERASLSWKSTRLRLSCLDFLYSNLAVS